MADNCPFLEAKGIKFNDNSARGTEICQNCPLEKCIFEVKLKGKDKEQYIREQLKVKSNAR